MRDEMEQLCFLIIITLADQAAVQNVHVQGYNMPHKGLLPTSIKVNSWDIARMYLCIWASHCALKRTKHYNTVMSSPNRKVWGSFYLFMAAFHYSIEDIILHEPLRKKSIFPSWIAMNDRRFFLAGKFLKLCSWQSRAERLQQLTCMLRCWNVHARSIKKFATFLKLPRKRGK